MTHAPELGSRRANSYVSAAQDTKERWYQRHRARMERYGQISREDQLWDGWRRRHPHGTIRTRRGV